MWNLDTELSKDCTPLKAMDACRALSHVTGLAVGLRTGGSRQKFFFIGRPWGGATKDDFSLFVVVWPYLQLYVQEVKNVERVGVEEALVYVQFSV